MAIIRTLENDADAESLRRDVLSEMKALDAQFPGEPAFQSIMTQLEYIGRYLKDASLHIPRRQELTFGFLGVRFVREFDEQLSDDLAQLSQYLEDRGQAARG